MSVFPRITLAAGARRPAIRAFAVGVLSVLLLAGPVAQAQTTGSSGSLPSAQQRLFGNDANAPSPETRVNRGPLIVDDRDWRNGNGNAGERDWRSAGDRNAVSREDDEIPDEPLYEDFSRYIRETTGKVITDALPIKRSDNRSPKLPDSYVVGSGDQIEIQVWGSMSAQYRLTLDDSGYVFVPDVGSIQLAGVKASDLTGVLSSQFRRIYKGFELRAVVSMARAVSLYVAGQAHSVGLKNVSATHTLLSATLAFARPSSGGSRRFVEFQRGRGPIQRIDLYCFFRAACPTLPEVLQDGDTIRVPERAKLVAVGGSVSRPGIYELLPNETVDDLLRYAGGLSVAADRSAVNLYSFGGPGGADRLMRTVALPASCAAAGACPDLKDGDYLDIQPRVPLVKGVITVVAQGVDSIKVELRPGMRLLDVLRAPFDRLIPAKTLAAMNAGAYAALSELDDRLRRLDLDSITLNRLDRDRREYTPMSVNYRAAAQTPGGPDNVALKDGDVIVLDDTSGWKLRRDEQPVSVRVLGEVARPGRYRFVGARSLGDVLTMAGGATSKAALWSAVILRQGDGRNAVNREVLDRALKAVSEYQLRQERVNNDSSAPSAVALRAPGSQVPAGSNAGTLQTLNTRASAEAVELMRGRDIIYLASQGSGLSEEVTLSPNDVVIIPPQQDTFSCQGAFFRPGEFAVGRTAVPFGDAVSRCGPIHEMDPNLYHFIARENRVCRVGWMSSCPKVEGGDLLVAVPEVVTKRGMASVLEWVDLTMKTLTSLATLKVLSQ